jgi:hypothetical protein
MKYLIFIFLLIFAFSCKAQVKLTQVEKSTVKWDVPVAKRVIAGQTGFFQTYMDLNDLIDSLGISFGTVIDSMKYESDTLKLYTTDGLFQTFIPSGTPECIRITELLPETSYNFPDGPICNDIAYRNDSLYMFDSENWILIHANSPVVFPSDSTIINEGWGINVTESPTNTYTISADSSQVATKYDLTLIGGLGGSGTTNYVSKFTSSTNLGNSQIFDNGTSVGINDATPNAKLDVQGGASALIGLFKETGVTEEAQASGNAQETVSIQGSGAANVHVREVSSDVDAMFGVNTSNAYLGATSSHGLDLITGNNQRLNISNGGLVKINNLAGTGTRAVTANSTGELGTSLLGSVSSIATTLPITGGTITTTGTIGIQNATTSQTGALTSTDWNTFNNKENALTFNSPLLRSVNSISIQNASTSLTGALTSTDWNTFNNKMSSFLLAASGTGGTQTISNGNTVTITAGTGITATRSGGNITITNTNTNTDNQNLTYTTSSGLVGITGGTGYYTPTAYRLLANGPLNNLYQYTGTAGVFTEIPFTVADPTIVNSQSAFSVNGPQSIFTPLLTGQYLVSFKINVIRPNASNCTVALYRGITRITETEVRQIGSTPTEASLSGTFVVSLTNTQNISLRVMTNDSGTVGVRNSHFQITKIQ